MQSLEKLFLNGLIVLGLSLGLMVSAIAADQSFEKVKELAEKGDSFYQTYLGDYYNQGRGVSQDNTKAFYWHKKSAEQGHSSGQYSLGYAYGEGLGVRQDNAKAVEWFKKSAEQNNISAQVHLGTMYEVGEGVRQNKTTAKEWYGKGCDNGYQGGCDNYKRLNEQGH